jgi:hypothetical protein
MASTLQQLIARLQVNVSEIAKRRIHSAAAARSVDAGQVVTDLAMEHLPPIPDEKKIAAQLDKDAAA